MALPKSQSFSTFFASFTCGTKKRKSKLNRKHQCIINWSNTTIIGYRKHTSMLSGFISLWRTPQFLRCFSAIKSCFAYALTAVSLRPILRPNFFNTSRRFIWRDSKTKQRWFLYLKLERKRTQWRLFSGSAPANFFNIETSTSPALRLYHRSRGSS